MIGIPTSEVAIQGPQTKFVEGVDFPSLLYLATSHLLHFSLSLSLSLHKYWTLQF